MKARNCVIITCCLLLGAFLLGVSGVLSLTTSAAPEVPETGRLIGVFITREYLDLSAGQENRLYAELTDVTYTGEETGETLKTKEYVFDGVDGIRFFAPYIGSGSDGYASTQADEGITDSAVHFQSRDEEDSISLTGTVYIATHSVSGTFYMNPVYQTSDGEVYTVSGEGISLGSVYTPGDTWSQKLTETREITSPDAGTSSSTEIEVTFCGMEAPTDITLLEFNANHELLKRTAYRPGTLPERVEVQKDTAYLILETVSAEGVSRRIFQREDDSGYAFYGRDDGICLKQEWEIGWDS